MIPTRPRRREALAAMLFGAGGLGLRALATGLPAWAFARPVTAWADAASCQSESAEPQYLVLSMSSFGDPVNNNAPGTYDFPDIVHPPDPRMAPALLQLGATQHLGGGAWARLPQRVLDRTCFFHHATLTNNHPNLPKVMRLMGATAKNEMLPSLLSKALAPCLKTVQTEPVLLCPGESLTFEGRSLAVTPATALRDVLTHDQNGLGKLYGLHTLRDRSLDEIHGILKSQGTPAQRELLDRMARSHAQARSLSDQLLTNIAGIQSDESDGQVLAAATLIRMNVAAVVAVKILFGSDNHTDVGLRNETEQTLTGAGRIADLLAKLDEYGLADKVTFATLNVFGRTLKAAGPDGRGHWGNHHTAVLIGKSVRAGVIGGVRPLGGDYTATGIDSRSGAATDSGDVPFADTLGALGKTLGAVLGVPRSVLDANITTGKVVAAAVGSLT